MSDNEEEDVYPVELEHHSHRRSPPPMDEQDEAEMSQISADIDDAEKFELTFEIVDSSTVEEEGSPPPDDEIAKILTPPSGSKKKEQIDANLDEEAPENDENDDEKKKPVRNCERKSMAASFLEEFGSPLTTRRGGNSVLQKKEQIDANLGEEAQENDENGDEKKKSLRKSERKSMAAELLEEFRSPLSTRRGGNAAVGEQSLKRKSGEPLMTSTPKRPARP